jgi:hypothetical protein
MRDERFATDALLDIGVIAHDADNPAKKVEPYYFDARRGHNAHSRDIGLTRSLTLLPAPAHVIRISA